MLATQLTWLSFMLSRLAGQDTLTALSQTIPYARLLINSSNTLINLGFYHGHSPQLGHRKVSGIAGNPEFVWVSALVVVCGAC